MLDALANKQQLINFMTCVESEVYLIYCANGG